MAFKGSEKKGAGMSMPIKGRVPMVGGGGMMPADAQDFRQVPKIRMTKGSPLQPDQLGNDDFATSQPSQGIDVDTGQGSV